MPTLRIATFNVENLFSRAKVLNLYDEDKTAERLEQIAQLQRELARGTYDKPAIIDLYKQVKDYVTFNVMRSRKGHLVISRNQNGRYTVHMDGRADWFGQLEFRREKFDDACQKNTAKIIDEIDADILCLVEVESRPVLDQFITDRLKGKYDYGVLIDAFDPRGIDVGLAVRRLIGGQPATIGSIRTNMFESDGDGKRIFSRDCLEVEVKIGAESIFVLLNHFKSKSGRNQKSNDAKRKSQAEKVRAILRERYDLSKQYVVVLGDLNDTPDSPTLHPLLSTSNLHDVLALQFPNPDDRWTYHYKKNEQIDYLLISDKLKTGFKGSNVERRGIAEIKEYSGGTTQPLTSIDGWRNAASDHAAIWSEFRLT